MSSFKPLNESCRSCRKTTLLDNFAAPRLGYSASAASYRSTTTSSLPSHLALLDRGNQRLVKDQLLLKTRRFSPLPTVTCWSYRNQQEPDRRPHAVLLSAASRGNLGRIEELNFQPSRRRFLGPRFLPARSDHDRGSVDGHRQLICDQVESRAGGMPRFQAIHKSIAIQQVALVNGPMTIVSKRLHRVN